MRATNRPFTLQLQAFSSEDSTELKQFFLVPVCVGGGGGLEHAVESDSHSAKTLTNFVPDCYNAI
jgi:hypothetical protein